MLHDEQLFAGVQARIGLYLLVCQRAETLTVALCKEKRAVDNVIRYAIAIPQEAVFRQTEEFGFFVAQQQDIRIFKRFDGLNETTHNTEFCPIQTSFSITVSPFNGRSVFAGGDISHPSKV